MMKILGFIAYWALAVTQFLGVYTYFSNVLEWNGFISVIIALILGGIPLLGTVFGILGATQGWGWGIIPSLCLYLWPFILFGVAYVISSISSKRSI